MRSFVSVCVTAVALTGCSNSPANTSSTLKSKATKSIIDPPESPHASPGYMIAKDFARKVALAKREFLKEHGEVRYSEVCRPAQVWTEGSEGPISLSGVSPYDASVNAYIARGHLLRVLNSPKDELYITRFITEKFLIKSMMEHEGGSDRFAVQPITTLPRTEPSQSASCRARMYISNLGTGAELLWQKYYERVPVLEEYRLKLHSETLVNVLKALRSFHDSGFAHGSIDGWSIVQTENGSINLINLGSAAPFVDGSGNQLEEQQPVQKAPAAHLISGYDLWSPWHIESNLGAEYHSTRRDDIFRLAQTFYQMLSDGYRNDLVRNCPGKCAEFKRRAVETEYPGVPKIFNDFYRYTLTLNHQSSVDYTRWISMFKEKLL
jgi:hypothetical protein